MKRIRKYHPKMQSNYKLIRRKYLELLSRINSIQENAEKELSSLPMNSIMHNKSIELRTIIATCKRIKNQND